MGKAIRGSVLAVAMMGAVASGWYVIVTGCGSSGGQQQSAPPKSDNKGDETGDEIPMPTAASNSGKNAGPTGFTTTGEEIGE